MPGAPTTDDKSFNLSFNQGPGKGAVVAAGVMAFEADRIVNHAQVEFGPSKVNTIRMKKQNRK